VDAAQPTLELTGGLETAFLSRLAGLAGLSGWSGSLPRLRSGPDPLVSLDYQLLGNWKQMKNTAKQFHMGLQKQRREPLSGLHGRKEV
jgi:hypothetical protein